MGNNNRKYFYYIEALWKKKLNKYHCNLTEKKIKILLINIIVIIIYCIHQHNFNRLN